MEKHLKYRVVKDHIRSYDHSISLHVGEKIRVGQRDDEWTTWLWCTNNNQESAWVPEEVLDLHNNETATVNRDYNSIELTVALGEEVAGFERIGGWLWCRNENHEEGWIPLIKVVHEE